MATLREKWIAALRSGDYKQCRGQLKDANGFCCLGVLCDVIDQARWKHGVWDRSVSTYLPKSVDGVRSDFESILVHMNDTNLLTFPEIADYIEAHPEIDPVWTGGE